MIHSNGQMVSYGDGGLRLFYYAIETFANFTLKLQFRIVDPARQNSGVFLRFPRPTLDLNAALSARISHEPAFDPKNAAWRPVISGFEVQIDDNALGDSTKDFYGIRPEPNGLYKNRTGAIYKIQAGDRVLVVDDVLATGGTANAAAQLVGGTGASVVGFSFLIELDFLNGRQRLQGRHVEALLHYA